MSMSLTCSQRVVARVFRDKFYDLKIFDQGFIACIERFIVDFDGLTVRLCSTNVMSFIKTRMEVTNKDHSVEIRNTLCALCIFMMAADLTSFWTTIEHMKAAFEDVPEFRNLEESEWDRLLKYQAIVKTAHDLFGGCGQKGRVLFIANHLTGVEVTDDSLHGQKMATGSGASKATKRRCMIYERISGIIPEIRPKKRTSQGLVDEAIDDGFVAPATKKTCTFLDLPLNAPLQPIPTSSSSAVEPSFEGLSTFSLSGLLADVAAPQPNYFLNFLEAVGNAQPSEFTRIVQAGGLDSFADC